MKNLSIINKAMKCFGKINSKSVNNKAIDQNTWGKTNQTRLLNYRGSRNLT